MSLKAKLVSVISAFVLILTVAIVSVWAVSQANVTMGGTVGFKADNVYAKISAEITGMDENPTLPTLIFSEGSDASSEENIAQWNELALVFNSTGTPIEIEVTVENLSDERALYAKIDDQIGVVANLTKTVTSSSQDALGRYIEVPTSSSIAYTITLSPTDPNKSVNGEYRYLMTLVDETEIDNVTANIQVSSNQADLGSVSGSGLYAIGDTATLTATPSSSNTFLAWATSTDPNTMEIVSIDPTYSFEVSQDSPRAYYALFNQTTTTSQTVGDSVYTIYNEAKLAEVTGTSSSFSHENGYVIPSIVTSNENNFRVFSVNFSIGYPSITIPEGVVKVTGSGQYVTSYPSITISLPESLKYFGGSFHAVWGLTSISFPDGVTTIEATFSSCGDLTTVYLPSSLKSLKGAPGNALGFISGASLEHIYGEGNDYYYVDDNRALIVDGGKTLIIYAGNSATSYLIPEGVTSIGDYAFSNGSGLTEITIPEGVTSIGNYAFRGCSSLTSITIPEGVTSIGQAAFFNCSSLTSVTIEGVTSIGSDAFRGCSALTEITINGNISLGSYAFSGCSNLTKLTLGANVTTLPSNLFTNSNLTNLTTIVVEAGSSLSAALPTYGKWVKDGGSEIQTNFSGAGTYTRTDIQ